MENLRGVQEGSLEIVELSRGWKEAMKTNSTSVKLVGIWWLRKLAYYIKLFFNLQHR